MHASDYNTLTGFLGTYASAKSEGIYRFTLNQKTGKLSLPELYLKASDCKYLSLHGSLLASPVSHGEKAGIRFYDIKNAKAALLDEAFEEETTACYVIQDANFIYTANYHQGIVLIYQKTGSGIQLHKRIEIARGAGCHQILFHSHYLLVPCLLLDEIRIFDREMDYRPAGAIKFPRGTGPRHGVFTKDHHFFFLASELSNEIYMYRMQDKTADSFSPDADMELLSIHPFLSKGTEYNTPPATAAIRLSPDERHLYVSTRFADIISVFLIEDNGLRLVQQVKSGGNHPRDFVLTEDGHFLLAANRTEGGLVCFPIHPGDGTLGEACSKVPAPEAVSIVLAQDDSSQILRNGLQGN